MHTENLDPTTMRVEDAEAFFMSETATEVIRRVRFPAGWENPYPVYKECRAKGGFVEADLEVETFGLPISLAGMLGGGPVFTAVRYDEVAHVLSHYDQFTSTAMEPVLALGHNMLVVDPPEHKRHRLVVQSVFGRRAMESWRSSVIDPLVQEGLDQLEEGDSCELMRAFINEFPLNVIGGILGLPPDQLAHLHRLAEGMLLLAPSNPTIGMWAFDRIGRLFAEVVEERRRNPGDDVVSHLCRAEVDGESLSVDEVVTFIRLLLPAGFETTFRGIGSMMVAFLSHPDQRALVEADRSLIPRFVDEALRWESPVNGPCRVAVQDVELNGFKIPAGAAVQPSILSANHDETRFLGVDPDLFDITRDSEPHISFGFGPHLCLGSHLAKAEMEAALAGFLDRLPNLKLDPDHPAPKITGTMARGPSEVYVKLR